MKPIAQITTFEVLSEDLTNSPEKLNSHWQIHLPFILTVPTSLHNLYFVHENMKYIVNNYFIVHH